MAKILLEFYSYKEIVSIAAKKMFLKKDSYAHYGCIYYHQKQYVKCYYNLNLIQIFAYFV